MKTWSAVVMMAVFGSMAGASLATTLTDDFNRSDDYLGAGWEDTGQNFYIISNKAVNNRAGVHDRVAVFSGVEVGADAFTVQADVTTSYDGEFVGLAFNIQDASNYYFARWMNGLGQVVKVVDGSYASVPINAYAPGVGADSPLKVICDGSGNYTIWFGSQDRYFTDTGVSGGGVGMYYDSTAGGGTVKWDNFSTTFVPEPATLGLLAAGGLLTVLRRRR